MGEECKCSGEICVDAWGCSEGEKWNFVAKLGISEIIIRHGAVVDCISFKPPHSSDYSPIFGGNGGIIAHLRLDFPSEYLTGLSGFHGRSVHGDTIRSLKIRSNHREYGPYGVEHGKAFSFAAKDGMITGFHGWAGRYLNSIGVYIAPASSQVGMKEDVVSRCWLPPPPRSAAPWGGDGGRDWDDGVFSAVKGVNARVRVDSGALTAVQFRYEKEDGSEFLSPQHGCCCGVETHRKTIAFDKEGELLIGVEGFYGTVDGEKVVRSVTFITNKGKYGPLGGEIGTYFCSVNFVDCYRKVVGFHGRSGEYLNALGLHTQYLAADPEIFFHEGGDTVTLT